jgi:hypothetical protein
MLSTLPVYIGNSGGFLSGLPSNQKASFCSLLEHSSREFGDALLQSATIQSEE